MTYLYLLLLGFEKTMKIYMPLVKQVQIWYLPHQIGINLRIHFHLLTIFFDLHVRVDTSMSKKINHNHEFSKLTKKLKNKI